MRLNLDVLLILDALDKHGSLPPPQNRYLKPLPR